MDIIGRRYMLITSGHERVKRKNASLLFYGFGIAG